MATFASFEKKFYFNHELNLKREGSVPDGDGEGDDDDDEGGSSWAVLGG